MVIWEVQDVPKPFDLPVFNSKLLRTTPSFTWWLLGHLVKLP